MKKSMYIIPIIIVVFSLLVSCKEGNDKIEIYADDLVLEFDGNPHGIEAELSIQGGLLYKYVGIDYPYDSSIEPTQPGEYSVSISYKPNNLEKYKEANKTVKLTITLPYTISADGAKISNYSGVSKNVVLPTEYKGKPITSIENGTFTDKEIETIKFPITSFEINPDMFVGCNTITTFYISANTVFLDGAYPNGINLLFYDNPTVIKNNQFGEATGIQTIEIPQSVKILETESLSKIGAKTLRLPSHLLLDKVLLSDEIKTIKVYNGSKSGNKLADSFFKNCTSVKKIVVEQGLQTFGDRVFENCIALDELIIHSSVQSVGEDIFLNCNVKKMEYNLSFSLQNVGLTETLKEIIIIGEMIEIPSYAFYECEYVEKIILPNTVEEIGNYAFYCCKNLLFITIPSQLKSVGYYAFGKCSLLSEIALPETVSEILDGAFSECTSLSNLVLPSGLTQISINTFLGCVSLETINIPDGVQIIDNFAFDSCSLLKEVVLPKNLKSIGLFAFGFCLSLEEITIPSNVNLIGEHVFSRCDRLKKVWILSETIPTINGNIFSDLSLDCNIFVQNDLLEYYKSEYPEVNFIGIN